MASSSLSFGFISCFQILTSVLKVHVRLEKRASTLTEVISASVNHEIVKSAPGAHGALAAINAGLVDHGEDQGR